MGAVGAGEFQVQAQDAFGEAFVIDADSSSIVACRLLTTITFRSMVVLG